MIALLGRWWQFLRERHEPFGTSLMVLAFFTANGFVARPLAAPMLSWPRLLGAYVLIWLIFLHMRMFDEVKDFDFDREHNPQRPLARGLIPLMEFGVGTMLVLLTEVVIAAYLGWSVFYTYIMVLCFTLLMRMEFFIGDWMRPKLELYAITHTFSAALMGLLILVVWSGNPLPWADPHALLFALGNWFVFNVFEFGRKTFGREEERGGVDSYSARLRPGGAVFLLMINVAVAFALLWTAVEWKFGVPQVKVLLPAGVVALLVAAVGFLYVLDPGSKKARLYRGIVTFYLLAYHMAVVGGLYAAGL